MKKTPLLILISIVLLTLHSCYLNGLATSPYDMIRSLCVRDQSYVGLLEFGNFEGSVENHNPFTVNNVKLRGTLYNSDTQQRSSYEFFVSVPISAGGSATYRDKTFAGKHMRIERVEVISAERY